MANETVRVRVYTIDKCGFYRWGGSKVEFGSLSGVLDSLKSWTDGKALKDTNTFDPAAAGAFGSYCLSVIEDSTSGDFLLVLWNEAPSTAAGVANVKADSPVGEPDLSTTATPKGTISGFATYFWFMPSEERVVAAQVHKRATGLRELEKYMRGFLEKFSGHTVLKGNDIAGYRKAGTDPVRSDVYPRFNTGAIRRAGLIDTIRERRGDIKRLVRRETLALGTTADPGLLFNVLRTLGLDPPSAGRDELSVTFQLEITPSEQELSAMVEHWGASSHAAEERMGFEIDGRKLWLDEALVKSQFPLKVKWLSPEVVDPEELLTALQGVRANVLALEIDS